MTYYFLYANNVLFQSKEGRMPSNKISSYLTTLNNVTKKIYICLCVIPGFPVYLNREYKIDTIEITGVKIE